MITTLGELSTVIRGLLSEREVVVDGEVHDLTDYTVVRILNAVREYEAQGGRL